MSLLLIGSIAENVEFSKIALSSSENRVRDDTDQPDDDRNNFSATVKIGIRSGKYKIIIHAKLLDNFR